MVHAGPDRQCALDNTLQADVAEMSRAQAGMLRSMMCVR